MSTITGTTRVTTAIRIGDAVADLLVHDSGLTRYAAQFIMDRLVDGLGKDKEYLLLDLLDELRLCVGAMPEQPAAITEDKINS